jgi:hypothetical protein
VAVAGPVTLSPVELAGIFMACNSGNRCFETLPFSLLLRNAFVITGAELCINKEALVSHMCFVCVIDFLKFQ